MGGISFADFQNSHQLRLEKLKELRASQKKDKYPNSNKGDYKPSVLAMRMRYWRPDGTPTRVKLIPWKVDDMFFTYYQSWVKTKKGSRTVISNSRGGDLPVPDLVTHYAQKEENPNLLPSQKYVLTALILENFHKVPQKSARGTEYTTYERCQGTDMYNRSVCEHCDDKRDTVFGRRFHWSVGWGHKKQLEEELGKFASRCGSCSEGQLSTWAYACSNCDHVIANQKEERLSAEDEEFFRTGVLDCPSCEVAMTCAPRVECIHEKAGRYVEGCQNPQIVNPWDCELLISTTGKGSSTAIKIDDKEWEPRLMKEVEDWKLETMNFPEFFSFDTLDTQAQRMDRPNPFDEEAQALLEQYFDNSSETSESNESVDY